MSIFFIPESYGTYALPGTNRAIIVGESSLDTATQHRHVDTIVSQINRSHTNWLDIALPGGPQQGDFTRLKKESFCFIADTDSSEHCADTGANCMIVNNMKPLKNFRPSPSSGGIKRLSGAPVKPLGIGTYPLSIVADDGSTDVIEFHNARYLPSSLHNLIPPQLLMRQMKQKGYRVLKALQDDEEYVFRYCPSPTGAIKTITMRSVNDFFIFRFKPGYQTFSNRARATTEHATCQFCSFGDTAPVHVIDDDSIDAGAPKRRDVGDDGLDAGTTESNAKPRETPSELSGKPREPNAKPRETLSELSGKPREPSGCATIPYEDADFRPLSPKPMSEAFDVSPSSQLQPPDPDIIATKRKRH